MPLRPTQDNPPIARPSTPAEPASRSGKQRSALPAVRPPPAQGVAPEPVPGHSYAASSGSPRAATPHPAAPTYNSFSSAKWHVGAQKGYVTVGQSPFQRRHAQAIGPDSASPQRPRPQGPQDDAPPISFGNLPSQANEHASLGISLPPSNARDLQAGPRPAPGFKLGNHIGGRTHRHALPHYAHPTEQSTDKAQLTTDAPSTHYTLPKLDPVRGRTKPR